eukprot:Lankesteria_metandrocarpae@DN10312_c0_g1_i1.p1
MKNLLKRVYIFMLVSWACASWAQHTDELEHQQEFRISPKELEHQQENDQPSKAVSFSKKKLRSMKMKRLLWKAKLLGNNGVCSNDGRLYHCSRSKNNKDTAGDILVLALYKLPKLIENAWVLQFAESCSRRCIPEKTFEQKLEDGQVNQIKDVLTSEKLPEGNVEEGNVKDYQMYNLRQPIVIKPDDDDDDDDKPTISNKMAKATKELGVYFGICEREEAWVVVPITKNRKLKPKLKDIYLQLQDRHIPYGVAQPYTVPKCNKTVPVLSMSTDEHPWDSIKSEVTPW